VYKTIRRLIKWAFILAIFVLAIHYWLSVKNYLFTEDAVRAIALKHKGPNVQESYRKIHEEFRRQYPGRILAAEELQWIFVNAGGWMGSMCVIHASLTEYVLFFGSAIDTGGHSGRYWANVSDTVLTGALTQWSEGSLNNNSFGPGNTVLHAWGEATHVHFAAGTWMVEYGRGFIPSTMGFALADTVFSTHDFITMFYTFRIYGKALLQELTFTTAQYVEYIKDHI